MSDEMSGTVGDNSMPGCVNPTSAAAAGSAQPVPAHWSPEQALAVFECLHAMRQALWVTYGAQVQQAWHDQLVPDGLPPEFDEDVPF
jgi:hypothetical protein